jgi:hypothetical protein
MVAWPWVLLWQAAVLLPTVWLLWQIWHQPWRRLSLGPSGNGWMVGAIAVLGLSTALAPYGDTARWHSLAASGGLAALYALNGWLQAPPTATQQQRRWQHLVQGQGMLAIAFALLSGVLWGVFTYRPEQQALQTLAALDLARPFSFNLLAVRNWYPLGHQNYVAGYLVLHLPLLLTLAWTGAGWRRWVWGAGTIVALVDLYTTGSRGGMLGLWGAVLMGLLWIALRRQWSWRYWLGLGLGSVGMVAVGLAASDRVRRSLAALLRGDFRGSEIAYRWITTLTGWRMGLDRPWTGQGPGAVPLIYQGYRPGWAGREAELIHQLHNTPAQLWAELGIGGLLLFGAAIVLLGRWGWTHRQAQPQAIATPRTDPAEPSSLEPVGIQHLQTTHPSADGAQGSAPDADPCAPSQSMGISPELGPVWGGLWAGLWGYGLVSLTDYQLDNIAITGSIVVIVALLGQGRGSADPPAHGVPSERPHRRQQRVAGIGIGILLVSLLGVIPLHRAWGLSSDGFAALNRGDLNQFRDRLTQAHRLAPQDPYYPYQLAWNLGERGLHGDRPNAEALALREAAIAAFQTGLAIAPQWEFGHSNLGWLQSDRAPAAAAAAFVESLTLVPAKQGVAFGWAIALLRAQQPDLATTAFTLECLRHPVLLTSSLWQQPGFADLYPTVQAQVLAQWTDWLTSEPISPSLAAHLHHIRGSLHWWRGDWAAAAADWQAVNYTPGLALLAIAQGQDRPTDLQASGHPVIMTLRAWLEPEQRRSHLQAAWARSIALESGFADALPPRSLLTAFADTMDAAPTFMDWVQVQAPNLPQRNERLGFGVLARHVDGPQPVDYWVQVNNVPMVTVLRDVFPSPSFLPELDQRLMTVQQAAIAQATRSR